MKTSAITRIIIWSVVALLLLGVLLYAGSGNWFSFPGISFTGNRSNGYNLYSYMDDGWYVSGNGSTAAAGIRNINVEWVDGRVNIVPSDTDTITFSESYAGALEEQYQMHYYISGDTVYIQFCRSGVNLNLLRVPTGKELTVTVPRDHELLSLDIETVSGGISLTAVQAQSVDFEVVSGWIDIDTLTADAVDLETVSGGIKARNITADSVYISAVSGSLDILESDIRRIEHESVSGSVRFEPGANVQSVYSSTVSGSVRLTLPENNGFTARISEGSGSFNTDFPVTMQNKRTAVYKDGGATFEFDRLSGSITIEKK